MNTEQVAQIRKKICAGFFSWGNWVGGVVVRCRTAADLSVCRRLAAASLNCVYAATDTLAGVRR